MGIRNENDERFKSKMNAWLMIQVIGQTSINILNSRKLAKEMSLHLETLIYGEEDLNEFADYFIDSCLSSRSYKTTLFGALPMSDKDINEVTRVIPQRFGYGEESKILNETMWKAFAAKFDNVEEILKEAGI